MFLLSGLGIFFSILLLAYNKGYKSVNIYLGLFLLGFNIITLTHYFYIYNTSREFLAFVLSVPLNGLAFAVGPLSFLYVRSVLTDNTYFTKFDWVHFIVFAIIFFGRLPFNLESWESKLLSADEIISNAWKSLSYSKLNSFLPLRTNYALKGLHFSIYLLAIWYLIIRTKFKKSTLNEYPKQVKIISNWLLFFAFMVSLLFVFFALIILIFLNAQDKNNFQYEGNILFSLVFIGFLILILGLVLYPQILYGIPLERKSLIITANESSVTEKIKMETYKKIPNRKLFLNSKNSEIKKEPFKINQSSEKLFQKIAQNEVDKIGKLKKDLKGCLKEWCMDTTSHGFSNMVKADNWITRLAWLFLVITLTAYCFFSKRSLFSDGDLPLEIK